MDPNIVGIMLLATLFLFLFSGMPIAFALGVPSVLFIILFGDWNQLNMMSNIIFEGVNELGLLAVPLFILMGAIIAETPAGADLYEGVYRWLSKVSGGLAMSNVLACSIFAALCGSSPATAAAIGTAGIPEMRKRGYPDSLATGCIVGGGALGILIPPSITAIVYGISTQTSVGQLFIGGVIPGIVLTIMMCIWVFFYSQWKRKEMAGKIADGSDAGGQFYEDVSYTWKERFQGILKVLPFMILVIILLIVLYFGFATPSEAAGVASVLALIMVTLVYRISSFDAYKKIMKLTIKESTMILMICAMAFLFSAVLTKLHVTQAFTVSLVSLGLSKWGMMIIINIFLLIMGCLLPPIAIIMIVCPILDPLIRNFGFNPIWFGVIVTINMELGMLTPPFGSNLFIVKGIAPDIPLKNILIGSAPFGVCMALLIVICSIWPDLIMWLPNKMK